MNDTVEQYISYKEDILVAFSGGFDSFAMFLKLLEMKKYNVHLFYYELENNVYKTWCERTNLKSLVISITEKYKVKSNTNFYETSKLKIDIEEPIRRYFAQSPAWLFLLGYDCLCYEFPNVAVGCNKDDLKNCWSPLKKRYQDYINSFWNLIQEDSYTYPEVIFPLENMTKKEVLQYLKSKEKELQLDMISKIWTCEHPVAVRENGFVGYKPCEICNKCKELKENL